MPTRAVETCEKRLILKRKYLDMLRVHEHKYKVKKKCWKFHNVVPMLRERC